MPVRFASDPTPRPTRRGDFGKTKSIRQQITQEKKKFNVELFPKDLQRVVAKLTKVHDEEYALTFAFMVRTASELHRAWHMTLLTSKILQQIKDKFGIHTTWELGVIKLKFRVDEGTHEIHRKVPYDYDSEFQDLYAKIAIALTNGYIDIHEALKFQQETKEGLHTAASGLFLRNYPGRLILYPLEAATCAVIFFSGDWHDAGVAAVTGLAAGLVEWFLNSNWTLKNLGNNGKVLTDLLVGISTGVIGGLFYKYKDTTCLPSVFLGTLYWFFYGTAFVIGILEIVAGELETGVIRFMAVSVKTFVLSLGSAYGLHIALQEKAAEAWSESQCEEEFKFEIDDVEYDRWWRIPLYLLCSASALGQYRFPISRYWQGLLVQLVGYEVQYTIFQKLAAMPEHDTDYLDTATSNAVGAIAAVFAAFILSYIVDGLSHYYNARLLHRQNNFSVFGECMFRMNAAWIRAMNYLGLGRKNDVAFLDLYPRLKMESEELNNPNHTRSEIRLSEDEKRLLDEAIIAAEPINIWSLLMPTVYQLVPGSLIAKMWYNSIFPPPEVIPGEDESEDKRGEDVFSGLMVTASSLALGLLLGMGLKSAISTFLKKLLFFVVDDETAVGLNRQERNDLVSTPDDDDPDAEVKVNDMKEEEQETDKEDDRENERTESAISLPPIPTYKSEVELASA